MTSFGSDQLANANQVTATVLAIFRTHGRLIAWGDDFVAPFGLTSARWQMLGALALTGQPLTAPQIAVEMGVSRQGAQKQLNLLIEDGLVAKSPNPYHRRSPYYRLTSQGENTYARIERHWNAHAKALGERLSPEDLAAAQRVLALLEEQHEIDRVEESQANRGDLS